MGRACEKIELSEIVEMNRWMIETFGGSFSVSSENFSNRNSLEYILEMLDETVFGVEAYSTIFTKAAAIANTIITRHVFLDGNKRTALFACTVFLEVNGYYCNILFSEDGYDEEAINTCVALAEHRIDENEFAAWIESKTVKLPE